MPRVYNNNMRAASAAPAASRHKQQLINRKPSYKVVLEQVTQQKKKLITLGSFQAVPPPGYTFIPAGDPQITNRCKQLARLDGAKVFAVSNTRHKHSGLSNQVHRIGYHFPSGIVGRACMSLGIDLSKSGHVLRHNYDYSKDEPFHGRPSKKSKLRMQAKTPSAPVLDQATVDTQAREAIKDLFPNIPATDLHAIVTHAFELGTERVGTASELSLPRRVQLAVVAHIRHNYTDYDKLLKQVPYQMARSMIEQPTLNKLSQWRGDDDGDDPHAMEDILREVIVIPDDDEEENLPVASQGLNHNNRDSSVEIVSSRIITDDMETRPIDYGTLGALADQAETPESDDDQEVTSLGYGQYFLDKRDQDRSNRNGLYRIRTWEQARDRQRQPHSMQVSPHQVTGSIGMHSDTVRRGGHVNESGKRLRDDHQFYLQASANSSVAGLRGQPISSYETQHQMDRAPVLGEEHHRQPILPAYYVTERPVSDYGFSSSARGSQNPFKDSHFQRHHTENVEPSHVSTLRSDLPSGERHYAGEQELHNSPHGPKRVERIFQSIESPVRPTVNDAAQTWPARGPPETHHDDRANLSSEHVRRMDDLYYAKQQVLERRRDTPTERSLNAGAKEQYGYIQIPNDHHDQHGYQADRPNLVRRLEEPRSFIPLRSPKQPRTTLRFAQTEQDAVGPVLLPREGQPRAVPLGSTTDHGSGLISQQRYSQSHNLSSQTPLQYLSRNSVHSGSHSAHSASYGDSVPYVSLTRENPSSAHIVSLDSKRPPVGAIGIPQERTYRRPVFGEPTQTTGHSTQRAKGFAIPSGGEYIRRDQLAQVESDRPRRYIPLGRRSENTRPALEPVPYKSSASSGPVSYNRGEQLRPVQHRREERILGSNLQRENFDPSNMSANNMIPMYGKEETERRGDVVFMQYDREQRVPDLLHQDQRRVTEQPRSSNQAPEIYPSLARVPVTSRGPHRIFDSQTGRELIVLE